MADRPVFLYAAVYDNIPDAESDYDAVFEYGLDAMLAIAPILEGAAGAAGGARGRTSSRAAVSPATANRGSGRTARCGRSS